MEDILNSKYKCSPKCGPDCSNCQSEHRAMEDEEDLDLPEIADNLVLAIFGVAAYAQIFMFSLFAFQ